MFTKVLRVLLLIVLLASISFASAQDEAGSGLNFIEYELENGLEVILVEDHSAPTVAVDVWYDVGGANDPAQRSGFAHLFEHMMFQGSAHLGKTEHLELVEAAGGNVNAYTTPEFTAYWQALPSNQLPLALWLEAERLSSLAVTQENLDNQRAVVIEEYQLRVGNQPYGDAIQMLNTLPFDYEPFKRPVIGSIEDLNAATVEDVRAFHSTYYVANNATLVVAGDIDVDETRALIEAYYGDIPGQPTAPQLPAYEPTVQTEAEIITLEDPLANVPARLIGYTVPPRSDPAYPAAELLARILGGGDSSRLARLMVDTGLAAAANTGISANRGPSLFSVILVPNAGVELDRLEQIYADELDRILAEGVEADELEKSINRIRSGQILSLERSFGLAERVQSANFYFDDPAAVFEDIDRFRDVTSEDIQQVISDFLFPEARHVITVLPGGDPQTASDPQPVVQERPEDDELTATFILEQDTPPEALSVSEFRLPEITEATLDNGLEVVIIERRELPIISLDFILPGGGSVVPADLTGLAGLTASVWTRGTTTRSAQDIASTIEQVGGALGAGAGADSLSVGAFALIEDAPLAFELLGDVIRNPTFPEEEIEIFRESSLTGLQFALADPGSLAGRAFSQLIYGEHPYGQIVTEESLTAITRDDIVSYYESQLDPEGAVLIVAGDISVDEALEFAEATFGEMESSGAGEALSFPEPPEQSGLNIYLVDRPGSTQADFIIGNLGTQASDPNAFKLRVMNEILGGGVTSRLFQNVREEQGYAYSIGSNFSLRGEDGTFAVVTATRNEVADDALLEILGEIETLRTIDVTDEELARIKGGIVGNYALGLETYQDFVQQVAYLKLNDLPLERIAAFPGNIDQVEQADVMAVAQDYIDPQNFVVVVVGDASLIEEGLSQIAPVTLLEAR